MNFTKFLLHALVPAVLLSAGTFASCEKQEPDTDRQEPETPAAPVIRLSSTLLSVPAEGGETDIAYVLEPAEAGDRVAVRADQDWIRTREVTADRVFLEIGPNEGAEDRIGTLTLSFAGAKEAYIVLMQARSARENDERFAIRVSDITTESANIRIEPADPAATWLYGVVLKSDYDAMGAQRYIDARIGQIHSMMAFGASFSDFLAKGPLEHTPVSLNDDTDYYVTAFDLTADEKSSGRVALKRFHTLAAAPSGCTFSLAMNGSRLTVTPSSAGETYLCDVISKELWDAYENARAVAQDYVSALKSYGQLSAYLCRGPVTEDYAGLLEKGGQYVALAFGYRTGTGAGITTEVFRLEFTY